MSIECADWLVQLREYGVWRRQAVASDAAEGAQRYLALLVHPRECASCHTALVEWFDEYAAELAEREKAAAMGLRLAEQMGALEDGIAAAQVSSAAGLEAYEQAEPVPVTHEQFISTANSQMNRANALSQLGRFTEAIDAYDQAERVFAAHGELIDAANSQMNRANALSQLGRFTEAIDAYDQAELVFITHEQFISAASCQMNRANALSQLSRFTEAIAAYDQAELVLVANEQFIIAARSKMNRGNALRWLGRFTEAIDAYDQAELVFAAHEELIDAANSQMNRANALCELGRFNEAIAAYDQAETVFATHEQFISAARCRKNRGNALRALGRHDEATETDVIAVVEYNAAPGEWMISGVPAGPAGAIAVRIGDVSLSFDAANPSELVALSVPTAPGSAPSPKQLQTVGVLFGAELAEWLETAEQDSAPSGWVGATDALGVASQMAVRVQELRSAHDEMAARAVVDRMVAWVQQQASASQAEATAAAMDRVGDALAKTRDYFLAGLAAAKDWVIAPTTFDFVGALAASGVRGPGRAGATAGRALSYLEIPALEQGGWSAQVEVSVQHELRMVFEPQKGVADDELAVLRAAVRTKSGEWVESPAEPGPVPLKGDPKRRYLLVVWSSATERFDDVFESTEGNMVVWFEQRR